MPPARSERGPGAVLAHHYTAATVVTGFTLAAAATYFGRFLVAGGFLLASAVALALAGPVRRRLDPEADAFDPETAQALEELRILYAEGEVSHDEYERRYDAVLERGPEALWAEEADTDADPDLTPNAASETDPREP